MKLLITFVLFVLFAPAVPNEQRSTIWNPSQIRWQEKDPDGSRYAVLEGNRSRAGNFTYAFFLPDGVWIQPHMHTGAARVFVVSGELLLGDGPRMNKQEARAIPAGSVFHVAKGAPHWEGARGDTLIIGVGEGPWVTTSVTTKPGR